MAIIRGCAIAIGFVWAAVSAAAGGVRLQETADPGRATRVAVGLTAEGTAQAAKPDGTPVGKPQRFKVEMRCDYVERVREVGPDGAARRAVRRLARAASSVNHQNWREGSQVRPEVSLLVAERRPGEVVVSSLGGPLTRLELDLVQGPGDPLVLPALLPTTPVTRGDRWTVADEAARSLADYDALAVNRLEGTLEALDDASARIKLAGEVRGAARGGEGTIRFDGTLVFDRKAGRVERLELGRSEVRKPGPVEAGLDVRSTLTVERREVETPPELADAALAGLPTDAGPESERLLLAPARAKYTLQHDRDWHLTFEDDRQVVLKRLDHGEVVAQCNLAAGPNAGRGRHQDPDQFRDDIRRALGERFVEFVGAGEVEGAPRGHYRYKATVRGRQGEIGILWHYYLVASPDGHQLLATFTLAEAAARDFGGQDQELIGSLEWKDAAAKPDK